MKFNIVFLLSAIAMCSGTASANEVLLTKSAQKQGNTVALDILSTGDATAFQFSIPLEKSRKINPKQLDLSKCVVDLPKTHQGHCVYRAKKNDILVMAVSMDNTLLPKGMIGIGTITAPASLAKSIKITDVEFASPLGQRVD